MPIVVVLLLVMVQAAIVVRDQIAVIHAAREGARAAAVSSGPSASAGRGARAAARLEPLTVATVTHGSQVTVTVKHVEHTDVPIVGAFLPDVLLTGSVTMQFEP